MNDIIHNIKVPIFYPELENRNHKETKSLIKKCNQDFSGKFKRINDKYPEIQKYIRDFDIKPTPIFLTVVGIAKIAITKEELRITYPNKEIVKKISIYDYFLNTKEKILYYTVENENKPEFYTLFSFDLKKKKTESHVRNITGDIIGAKYEGVYYMKQNGKFITNQVYFYNNGVSTLIYKEEDPTKALSLSRTSERDFLIISREDHDSNQLLLMRLNSMNEQHTIRPTIITEYSPFIRHFLDFTKNKFYLFVNTTDLNDYCWKLLSHEDPIKIRFSKPIYIFPRDFDIESVNSHNGNIICIGYKDGKAKILKITDKRKLEMRELEMRIPTEYFTAQINTDESIDKEYSEEFPLIINSQITHLSNYIINFETGEIRKDKEEVEVKIDPTLYVVSNVEYRNRDKTKGEYLVIHNKLHKKPLGLYITAYGSYNTVAYYEGNIFNKVMMDNGIYIIVPLVRGGGGFGLRHFVEGRRQYKMNALYDVIDATKDAQNKYKVKPKNTVFFGRSAGGFIATNLFVVVPDMFGAILTEVPYCDILRTTTNYDFPLVLLEVREFGAPRENLADLMNIVEMTPFFKINKQRRKWPKLYLTTGMNDPRVLYHEGLKFIKAVRNINPALVTAHIDENGGHIPKKSNNYYGSLLMYVLDYFNISIV